MTGLCEYKSCYKRFFMLTEMWNFMHYETLSLNKMSAIFRKIAAYIFLKVCLSFYVHFRYEGMFSW